jgi:hypothetical protein
MINQIKSFFLHKNFKKIFLSLLHEYGNVSTFDACIYFFAFCHRFKLSLIAQDSLLKMLHFMLPLGHSFPKTMTKLKTLIGMDKIELNEKYYCENCHHNIPPKTKYKIYLYFYKIILLKNL